MPTITIPKASPKLIIPIIEGLKSFVSSVVSFVFGFWDDTAAIWDDGTATWGGALESQKRPVIGEIKLKIPIVHRCL